MSAILIVEDDDSVRRLVQATLESKGYDTLLAKNGEQGLDLALQEAPQLVLLDLMLPGLDGFEVCRRLRDALKTSYVPIIILTCRAEKTDRLTGFHVGADDYIVKPFDTDELLARVESQLRRVKRNLLSQLTGLPCGVQVEEAIKELVRLPDEKWAVVYFDIDGFKEYNDSYGFLKGNELLKATGRIIEEVVRAGGLREPFEMVGHVGGDDFVVLTAAERAVPLTQEVLRLFDREAPEHYTQIDRERGYVITNNRQGATVKAPIVTLSAGIVTNLHRSIDNPWLVGTIAAEVKRKAKALPGSSYYIDQRS